MKQSPGRDWERRRGPGLAPAQQSRGSPSCLLGTRRSDLTRRPRARGATSGADAPRCRGPSGKGAATAGRPGSAEAPDRASTAAEARARHTRVFSSPSPARPGALLPPAAA